MDSTPPDESLGLGSWVHRHEAPGQQSCVRFSAQSIALFQNLHPCQVLSAIRLAARGFRRCSMAALNTSLSLPVATLLWAPDQVHTFIHISAHLLSPSPTRLCTPFDVPRLDRGIQENAQTTLDSSIARRSRCVPGNKTGYVRSASQLKIAHLVAINVHVRDSWIPRSSRGTSMWGWPLIKSRILELCIKVCDQVRGFVCVCRFLWAQSSMWFLEGGK
jgi:hypothetical protein